MKKRLCLILTIVIIISITMPIATSGTASRLREAATVFCNEVRELNEKYPSSAPKASVSTLGTQEPEFNYENTRLIVKTARDISQGAIDCVIGNTYSVFQYKNHYEMKQDEKRIKSLGYLAQADSPLRADAYNTETSTSVEYVNSGASYTKAYFNNNYFNAGSIVVGVLDTGIYYNNGVFNGRYVSNNINYSSSGGRNDVTDDNGHGTSVASIIVMSTPDNVKVKGYKILDSDGLCSTSTIVSVLQYIASESNKPDIINISIGGYNLEEDESSIIYDAIKSVTDTGIAVCCAAGNEFIPAKYNDVGGSSDAITVGSCNSKGEFSAFSDYGDDTVDITAIGENILSADMGTAAFSSENKSGTSFSSPMVAAACAYIKIMHPSYSPAELKKYLKARALPVADDDVYYFGSGILNFINLIEDGKDCTISPDKPSGIYDGESLEVAFDLPEDTTLYYSIGGITPDTEYSSPITITDNCVLRYALMKDGAYVSDIMSEVYELNYYATPKDVTLRQGTLSKWEGKCGNVNIIIPNTIDGIEIKNISSGAFKNSNIHSISLPDSITKLETNIFNGSTLAHIYAKEVTQISTNTFYNCSNLRSEYMPKLERAGTAAFYNCKKLHKVSFGDSLMYLYNYMFYQSGLLEADFSNVVDNIATPTYTFAGSTLFTCNIPNITKLGISTFEGCLYLHSLNINEIKSINKNFVYGCTYVKELNLTHVEDLYSGALAGCYIENIYLPKVTKLKSGNCLGAKYLHCETLNMPNFESWLDADSICYSTVKNLLFRRLYAMAKNAIYNSPYIDIICMPYFSLKTDDACSNWYFDSPGIVENTSDTEAVKSMYYDYTSPSFVYVPDALNTNCTFNNLGVIYCNKQRLVLKLLKASTKTTVITNDNVGKFFLELTAPSKLYRCNIIVENSDTPNNINIFNSSRLSYKGISDGSINFKITSLYSFSIPLIAIPEMWSDEKCGTIRYGDTNSVAETARGYILDVNQDGFINAKDYAMAYHMSHYKS